jgi:hypothetical protein
MDDADQVADSVFDVAGGAGRPEQAGRPAAPGAYDAQQPWSLTAAAGQAGESVAPYAADLPDSAAPQSEDGAPPEQRPRSQTGWSRWAIDKFSKALGDH